MTGRFGPDRDERGVSGLLEVTVVLLILGLILGTLYSTIFSSQNTVLNTNERLRNLDEARTLIATLTKDVRTAVRLRAGTSPFVTAQARAAEFYANLDTAGAPVKVRLSIDGDDQLIEEVWTATSCIRDPDSDEDPYLYEGDPTVRLVGHFVANSAAEPLFTYLDETNVPIAQPISGTRLLDIDAVRIDLRVKRDSGHPVNETTIQNRVRLPNVDYKAEAPECPAG